MNAAPLLQIIVSGLKAAKLEAVLIGDAAAAMHGAPVTTLDFDFMFRETPANVAKLKRFADHVDGVILRPFYPISGLYRVINEDNGLQADFMSAIHGVKSFNSLCSRAQRITLAGQPVWLADLSDIIASKRATDRPRGKAVLEVLIETYRQKEESKA